jgi:hypothetical protein
MGVFHGGEAFRRLKTPRRIKACRRTPNAATRFLYPPALLLHTPPTRFLRTTALLPYRFNAKRSSLSSGTNHVS